MKEPKESDQLDELSVAIIGMAGRFPGAPNLEAFWRNLRDGVESISFFSDEELTAFGVAPSVLRDPNYVKAAPLLDGVDLFDASFFGINPREAVLMDPQHRVFLECAWEALESAGYDPGTFAKPIGMFAGAGVSTYLLFNLFPNRDALESAGGVLHMVLHGNDKDHLTTRVSYKLNLKGPSLTVQTACSTSLVAVHLACQSLLNGECDMALAGGVSIFKGTQKSGYVYQEGGIMSPDGHCRAFDARAQGTIFGDGVGIVVLKKLRDALADGDHIHTIIRGSAVNNDGSRKVGYTAPSIDGQAAVIAEALSLGGIPPETVGYIETHGTGTALGDPIEVAALTQVFRGSGDAKGWCAIGSVKTNIGHLNTAAGIAGLIKTVLALTHKMLPPSLHFGQPNPEIDLADSPFYVPTTLVEWKAGATPRRAGVSSFGIGGTNAHVVLEEASMADMSGPSRGAQLLVLSARTASALEAATINLIEHLRQHADLNLADAAYTLLVGRRDFSHRRALVCHDVAEALRALETRDSGRVMMQYRELRGRPVVFMFPGQGAQYVNMGLELYEEEAAFRDCVDRCADLLEPHLGIDLRKVVYPGEAGIAEAAQELHETITAQPALFVLEYALATLWKTWGVRPRAIIGHSVGEYVAACLAGVFTLEEALALVAIRGQLMQTLPRGAMLAVSLPEAQLRPVLGGTLSLAAVNGPSLCVVSGPAETVVELEDTLSRQGITCRRLHTSHAFHSVMMEPVVKPFADAVGGVNLKVPEIPYVSNVTGTWIKLEEAVDPAYWARHLRETVRFEDGLRELLRDPNSVLLEVGPGRTLSTFARQHGGHPVVLTSMRHPDERGSDFAALLNALGRLWLEGADVDWSGYYANERRRRVPLPTYPFERQRYWIEARQAPEPEHVQTSLHETRDIADWFFIPSWRRTAPPEPFEGRSPASSWLVFTDAQGLGAQLVNRLEQLGQDVTVVAVGEGFRRITERLYAIDPRRRDDYDAVLDELSATNRMPEKIVHMWTVAAGACDNLRGEKTHACQQLGFDSLLFVAQALGKRKIAGEIRIAVVTSHVQDVTGEEQLCPEKATVLGPRTVIPQEYPHIMCCSIDIVVPPPGTWQEGILIDELIGEVATPTTDAAVAYRGNHRWVQMFEAARIDGLSKRDVRLRNGGVYLITGGLGGIGLALAEYLARTVRAKLILTGRRAFPPRGEWETWLATHDDQQEESVKIRKLRELEKLGSGILVGSVDVTDLEAMRAIVREAYARFSVIHGVIHAAGVAGGGVIELKTPEMARRVLAPKVDGTRVLEAVFADRELDFLVLCSSVASITGGFGQVDYCAANVFLDAFSQRAKSTRRTATMSINWDAWQEVGMAAKTAVPRELEEWRQERLRRGISPEEGVEAFRRVLGTQHCQVIVSTRDFQAVVERSRTFGASRIFEEISEVRVSGLPHPRPQLSSAYVAPRNSVEQAVAKIWQEVMGLERVGVHDDFFELGGHSLLALQLIPRVRQRFKVNLQLRALFQTRTVAELALLIEEEVIEEIENLEEDEVRRLMSSA